MINNIFRIYMSHTIRGRGGLDATEADIKINLAAATRIGVEIKAYLLDWEKMDRFPRSDLYVPADHDEFVQIAWHKEYLNEKQVLEVDCDIISRCDLVIIYGNYVSRGMKIELDFAQDNGIAVFKMPSVSEMSIEGLRLIIYLILKGMGLANENNE